MNFTNSTVPVFSFLLNDAFLISFQTVAFLVTFPVLLLLILMRKFKELKFRGILPYIGIIAIWIYIIRFYVGNFSWIKTNNELSFTYKFLETF
jgi:hypothetical protein